LCVITLRTTGWVEIGFRKLKLTLADQTYSKDKKVPYTTENILENNKILAHSKVGCLFAKTCFTSGNIRANLSCLLFDINQKSTPKSALFWFVIFI
jgi:hypothetical protein